MNGLIWLYMLCAYMLLVVIYVCVHICCWWLYMLCAYMLLVIIYVVCIYVVGEFLLHAIGGELLV